ncbi:hypothetical protein Tco_0577556 [Tanacetum coccineum]
MERGFLSQKGSEGGRGVKEKKHSSAQDATMDTDNVGVDVNSDANVKPTASASLSASVSFATLLKGDTSQISVNFRTLITPTGNKADVVVSFYSSGTLGVNTDCLNQCLTRRDRVSVIATKLSTPLMLESYTSDMCMQSWGRLSYARAMIELRADVESKDIIGMVMPKLVSEGFYMCTIRIEYKWKPLKCSSCKVFGYVLNECPKNIVLDVEKNLKNPRQAARYVHVDTKVAVASKEVRNSNPFDVLNSVEKRCDFGTNRGHSKSTMKGPNSGVFLQIIDGKLTLVDDDGKLLPKVVSMKNVDSDSEVKDVVDDHVVCMASTCLKSGADGGYATNSLLEQWRTTKRDDDYDPYDDDLYESQDMSVWKL